MRALLERTASISARWCWIPLSLENELATCLSNQGEIGIEAGGLLHPAKELR